MQAIISWLEQVFTGLPLPFLEVWGRFSFLVGSVLAIFAYCGFTFRQGSRWGWGRERQAWNTPAFLSMPLTFILIIGSGYLGSFVILVPGAQTFESLKDLVVFLCIVLFGYPALITVPFAYGLSDLIEGVPPEYLLNWLPGYFINPTCFWIAYQFIGKDPDFRRMRTWAGYAAFVLVFMILEPVLWGYLCSSEFPPAISYRSITPALFFTTGITWILAPWAMLAALPLARRAGLFWAEIPGHVNERGLWRETHSWEAGERDVHAGLAAIRRWPIRMVLLLPFIALVLVMVGLTAYVTLTGAEDHERMLTMRLHHEISENISSQLHDHLALTSKTSTESVEGDLSKLLRNLPVAQYGRVLIVDRQGHTIASTSEPGDRAGAVAVETLRRLPGGTAGLTQPVSFQFDHVTEKPLSKEAWLARATAFRSNNAEHPDWVVITALPESFYLAGVRAGNSRSAMVFAVALLLSLAIAAMLASMVTEPIRRLSNATVALAGGDRTLRVPVSRLEELDNLAEAFSHMSDQLRISFDRILSQIEERKRRERELEISENRLQLAVKAGKFGIWDWDVAQDRLIWDEAMHRMYGVPVESFGGKYESWKRCVVSDDLAAVCGALDAALRGERPFDTTFRVLRPDGSLRHLRGVAQTIRGEHGQTTRVVGINWDITEQMQSERERQQLEAQFRQAQKMESMGQLAGGVAHDFNNLLTVIQGYAELLRRQLPEGSPEQEKVRAIMQSGNRAVALTRQLLAFGRKTVLEPKVLDPNAVVQGISKVLRRLIGEDIELRIVLGEHVGLIQADPALLDQALINLAINARDAMPSGGTITLETRNGHENEAGQAGRGDLPSGPYAILAVSDTGQGIPESVKSNIFEPFFTTKGPGKGTGLGLAMVYGFVKQSGGHVSVDSTEGRGSCFKLYLPCVELVHRAPDDPVAESKTPRGHETILLVEDEVPVRSLAREYLESCGYRVLEAGDGVEAISTAESHGGAIQLLVTDVVMPNMGGRQLAQKLAITHPETRVLYVSGYANDAVLRHGVEAANLAFLQKPFLPEDLARKVREVLDGSPQNERH
ncbi:MAG: hypothetical protein AMXMBFR7_47750 [Planctomycetota bacterium]